MKQSTTPRPVHFEIFADDPARAAKFYTDVFGWEIKKWGDPKAAMDYWIIKTGEMGTMGIDGGLGKHTESSAKGAANAYICTMGVGNFDEYEKKILDAGGKVQMEKHDIPGVGMHGYYFDTEGNIFGILQPSEEMMKMGEGM